MTPVALVLSLQVLRGELKEIIAQLLELEDFSDEDHFVRDLRADSMLLEELIVSIEKRYHCRFPNEEMRSLQCLNDVVRVVARILHVPS